MQTLQETNSVTTLSFTTFDWGRLQQFPTIRPSRAVEEYEYANWDSFMARA
jgi:hypothetical protein